MRTYSSDFSVRAAWVILIVATGVFLGSGSVEEPGPTQTEVISHIKVAMPEAYTKEDVYFMAEALYFEAQDQPILCKYRVAMVIDMRRYSTTYPNTIEEVVWQPYQFSYTKDGKHERMTDNYHRRLSMQIAEEVLAGKISLDPLGAIMYYNPDLVKTPHWEPHYELVVRCGDHLFYKSRSNSSWG